jgi:uncharacterized membrane protein YedE/YeeE
VKGTLLALFLSGLLFGVGLGISGMTNPAKVIGFLDVTGAWDPSLALVMAGALGAFAPLNLLIQRRGRSWSGGALPPGPSRRADSRTIVGAALFGIGWGLAGFCPGPAIANLGSLRTEALVFVPAMAAGMVLAQKAFAADR